MKSFLFVTCLILQCASAARAATVLIKHVTVISGLPSSRPLDDVDVLVVSGVIKSIAMGIEAKADTIFDGTGKTLVPGLIDCHTHLLSVPGSLMRDDPDDVVESQQVMQLSAYLAAGVTTVLDAAAPPEVLTKWEAITHRPRIYGLSPFFTPAGGYFGTPNFRTKVYQNLSPPIVKGNESSSAIGKLMGQPSGIGIKVTVEEGFGPVPIWPIFDDATLEEIRAEAQKGKRKIFVHAMTEKAFAAGLKLKPYAFVHGGFATSEPSAPMLEELKRSGVYVVSTLAVYDLPLLLWQKTRFDDEWLRLLVPKLQIETALNQSITDKVIQTIAASNAPTWVPSFLSRMMAKWFFREQNTALQLVSAMRAIKMMYDAGIPVVMGSDSGNWPMWTTFFHAYGTTREMELLEASGIPPEEIIVAATSRAAQLLGKSDEIGSIQAGKKADMILLGANPLTHGIKSFRLVSHVFYRGNVSTPQELSPQR